MIGVGVLIFVIIIVAVGCIIRRKMINDELLINSQKLNSLSHFDHFMPKQKLE